MNVNRRTRMVFVSAAVVVAVAVSVTQRRWWEVVDLAYLGIIAIVLAPGFLAVRQLVNPRAEPAVSWARALLSPAILGAAVGGAAHAATMWLQKAQESSQPWAGFGEAILIWFAGVPLTALAGCLILRKAGIPRPWLTGPAGLIAGIVLTSAYREVALAPPGIIAHILLYLTGYFLTALAIGPLLPAKSRLAVYAVLIAALPTANLLHPHVAAAQQRASIERLTIPLLVPDLPGYTIRWVYAAEGRNSLHVTLRPEASPTGESYQHEIEVRVMPLPRDFEPPEQCLPVYDAFRPYLNELGPCSEQVHPRLWRSGTEVHTWYVVRRGDVLIVVGGGSKVTPDIVLAAATSVRPTTPRELVP